jgi:colanic acid/amylovoran biosynthesis protein
MPSRPIPISFFSGERDVDRVNEVMHGVTGFRSVEIDPTPAGIARAVSQCRLVVTGSYHAGVFALSQGIPVVALAGAPYYQSKFLGLKEQFDVGCSVVDLSKDFQQPLRAALSTSYQNAFGWREPLLTAARRQIDESRALYATALSFATRGSSVC